MAPSYLPPGRVQLTKGTIVSMSVGAFLTLAVTIASASGIYYRLDGRVHEIEVDHVRLERNIDKLSDSIESLSASVNKLDGRISRQRGE